MNEKDARQIYYFINSGTSLIKTEVFELMAHI